VSQVTASGEIKPHNLHQCSRPKVSAELLESLVKEGDKIKKGDRLFAARGRASPMRMCKHRPRPSILPESGVLAADAS